MRDPLTSHVCWSMKVEITLDDFRRFYVTVKEVDGEGVELAAQHSIPQERLVDAKGRLAEYVIESAIRSLNEAARQRIRHDCPTFRLPLSWQGGPRGG